MYLDWPPETGEDLIVLLDLFENDAGIARAVDTTRQVVCSYRNKFNIPARSVRIQKDWSNMKDWKAEGISEDEIAKLYNGRRYD